MHPKQPWHSMLPTTAWKLVNIGCQTRHQCKMQQAACCGKVSTLSANHDLHAMACPQKGCYPSAVNHALQRLCATAHIYLTVYEGSREVPVSLYIQLKHDKWAAFTCCCYIFQAGGAHCRHNLQHAHAPRRDSHPSCKPSTCKLCVYV